MTTKLCVVGFVCITVALHPSHLQRVPQGPTDNLLLLFLLLLLVCQMETPVSSMKVAVHRRTPQATVELVVYGSVVWPDSLSEWLRDGPGLQ